MKTLQYPPIMTTPQLMRLGRAVADSHHPTAWRAGIFTDTCARLFSHRRAAYKGFGIERIMAAHYGLRYMAQHRGQRVQPNDVPVMADFRPHRMETTDLFNAEIGASTSPLQSAEIVANWLRLVAVGLDRKPSEVYTKHHTDDSASTVWFYGPSDWAVLLPGGDSIYAVELASYHNITLLRVSNDTVRAEPHNGWRLDFHT